MDEKLSSTDSPSSPSLPGSPDTVVPSTYIKPQGRKLHDPDVRFEEYYHYAQRTREEEKTLESPILNWREIVLRKKKNAHDAGNKEPGAHSSSNLTAADFANRANRLEISDEEWTNASRAYRTASWGACENDKCDPPLRTGANLLGKVFT